MVNGSSDGKMAQASFLKEYTWVMAQTALQESLFVGGGQVHICLLWLYKRCGETSHPYYKRWGEPHTLTNTPIKRPN